jgi:formate/nitrite transporter FocA (FNT family)
VSKQGHDELNRPAASLLWSAIAGGIAIMASVSVSGALHHYIPEAGWREAVVAWGYPVGFLIVILGRIQLFTEQTVVAILPFAREPSLNNLGKVAKLWLLVFTGNVLGAAVVAALVVFGRVQSEDILNGMIAVSAKLQERSALATMMQAIPAGFIMASIAWIRSAENEVSFGIVLLLTYAIGVCGFAHVVAGAAEAFLLLWNGSASFSWLISTFLIPALVGNVIGGTFLFAALAHAQVQQEL